ncbi:MAG: His-Xaa-Ser system radical SAM maturase HxsB, partial [Gemmatimonadaceae bacterium]
MTTAAREVFAAPDSFRPADSGYALLPFRFLALDGQQVVVNEAGEHLLLSRAQFDDFVGHRLGPDSSTYSDLKAKQFLADGDLSLPITLLALKCRTKRSFLAGFTKLHIFVVSLRCDHACKYCQVSRVSLDRGRFDMTRETALLALDCVFRSPSRTLKIEFQGGEPLLNFEVVRFTVEEAERRSKQEGRIVQFVITTNLAFITDDILGYLRDHNIRVSTSLDGPAFLHNSNRPRPGGDAYERTIAGIHRSREYLGPSAVSATMTTTKLSLEHPTEIIDEYVAQGFSSIFLRPLSPYGFAAKTHQRTGYEVEAFLDFYKRALEYIIELNRRGVRISEIYSQILLTKMLTPFSTGYVDLQSPAGAGIG